MIKHLGPFYLGAALGLGAILGCGPGASEVRVRYGTELARCAANERAIVDRPNTTAEEDLEALELERARCDAARLLIESGGVPQ